MQRIGIVALSLAAGLGCGVDRIVHEEGPSGADGAAAGGGEAGEVGEAEGGADDGGAGEDQGTQEREGNFPEPAFTVCGALPDGIAPIDELASAFAVTGPRSDDPASPPEVLRIRLASFGIEPDGPIPYAWDTAPCEAGARWGFAFDIPVEHMTVGVHALADVTPAFGEHFEISIGEDCGDGGEAGGQGDIPFSPTGEIELFVVTDTCVVGEIRGAQGGFAFTPNGGFVAQRSAVACVPMWSGCE
jgi:hypothetical protein